MLLQKQCFSCLESVSVFGVQSIVLIYFNEKVPKDDSFYLNGTEKFQKNNLVIVITTKNINIDSALGRRALIA